jgi:hypothetical protein
MKMLYPFKIILIVFVLMPFVTMGQPGKTKTFVIVHGAWGRQLGFQKS